MAHSRSSLRRILLEIKHEGGRCTCCVHGLGDGSFDLGEVALGPEATLEVKRRTYSLAEVWDVLVRFEDDEIDALFDHTGQNAIGRYLFEQTLGSPLVPEFPRHSLLKGDPGEVRIVSDDPTVLRLPWILLADGSHILSQEGWSITLSGSLEAPSLEPEARPSLLVIAPGDLQGYTPTNAISHYERLKTLLSSRVSPQFVTTNLKQVGRWQDVHEALTEFQPDFVYFYGHGKGDQDSSSIILEGEIKGMSDPRPIVDLATLIRNAEPRPCLVYLNCCNGDSAGLLGAGQMLRDSVPAVVANRTAIEVPIADGLGIAFWRSVLLEGLPPDRAIAHSYSHLHDLFEDAGVQPEVGERASFDEPGWMTPVIHVSYGSWLMPGLEAPRVSCPYSTERFDRGDQIEAVRQQIRKLLDGEAPPWRVVAWAGAEGQGAEGLHDHLLAELGLERMFGHIEELRFEWPMPVLDKDSRPDLPSMKEALAEALRVTHLTDDSQVEHAIHRQDPKWSKNASVLFYLRLPAVPIPSRPVALPRAIDWPKLLLMLWYSKVSHHFRPPRYGLVALPLITDLTVVAQELLDNVKYRGEHPAAFSRIFDLGSVRIDEVESHLNTHYPNVLRGLRHEVAKRIWHLGGEGRYEDVLRYLGSAEDLSLELSLDDTLRLTG